MRKIRETLRLRLEAGLSYRQISASTKTSIGYRASTTLSGPYVLPHGKVKLVRNSQP